MRQHAKEFKNEIQKNGRQLDSKIIIKGSELVLGAEDLFSVTPVTNSTLLKSVMKEVDFESKKQIGIGQEVNIKSGVKVNGEYEYIDYGNYSVYKSEYKAETDTYSHICYDKMLKTMIDYTPLDITYPINLREYINAIATKCGLEFADKNSAFANYNTSINEDHFSNGNYTFRDVLDYIAQLVGGWLCINDNDELEIRYPELAKNYDKVSGENVSFISNVEDEINTIIIDGKSEQATRSGKNLLENKTKNSGISRGVTFTLNGDGSYTLNGTNDGTGNATVFLSGSSNPTTLKAGTYYTIPTPNGVQITGAKIGGGYFQLASSSTNKFTLNEDTQAQIYIQVPNGTTTTYNNIKVYPMISTTPITQSDYEPYGVMPSPDYPSEIESVKGKNLFDINTATLNSALKWVDGTYSPENLSVASDFIKIEKGKSYISKYKMQIILFNENKEYIGYYNNTTNQYYGFTIPTDSDCSYVKVSFRSSSNNNVDFTTIGDIQLEKNKLATDYLTYNTIQVKNVGKNLFDKNKKEKQNGASKVVLDTGVRAIVKNAGQYRYFGIKLGGSELLGKTITWSRTITPSGENIGQIALFFGNENSMPVVRITASALSGVNSTHIPNTFPNNTNYIYVLLYANSSGTGNVDDFVDYTNLMFVIGDSIGEYEPYQENKSLFVLDQPLRSLPNGVKDIAYIKNNILYVDRKVGTVIFNGSESWNLTIKNDRYSFWKRNSDISNMLNYKHYKLCNYFEYENESYLTASIPSLSENSNDVNHLIIFNTDGSQGKTVAEWKNWLSTHNTQVDYELAEPYTEEVGEVDTLSTFKGVNNVSLDANIQTNMTITYPTEYEELDKHFLKDVNVSFSKKYGSVNSVVFSRGNGSDNIYRKDNMSISRNGLTEIKITGNPFLEGNDRENFIQQLFDKINGLEFYIMDVASTGIMYLELGDLYYFNMIEEKPSLKSGLIKSGMRKAQGSSGGKFLCLLMNDEIKITQGLEESIYSDEPEITETNYKTASITDTSIKNAIIQTNKNSAEILLKVNSDEVVSAINLSPENIKISSAKLDIDAIATFTNSKLAEAGSTVINGANITTGSINCDRLNGGTINGQAIRGGSISIEKGVYYFNMGTSTSNPNCSGLNVGGYGVKAYSDITATGFAITDGDTGKSQSINIYDGHGRVWYLTFTGGILTASEYK